VGANSTAVSTPLFAQRREIIATAVATAAMAGLVIYLLWPRPAFHITNAQIGSQRAGNRTQLFVNIYFSNDGDPADYRWSAATGLVRSGVTSEQQLAFVRKLEAAAAVPGEADKHPPFPVRRGEDRWFTVYGPSLARDDFRRFVAGGYAFYFAATIVARENVVGHTTLSFCGFNPGGNPVDIHPCP
jgi:hypothetical protein